MEIEITPWSMLWGAINLIGGYILGIYVSQPNDRNRTTRHDKPNL